MENAIKMSMIQGLSTYGWGFMFANGQALAPTRPGRHTRESGCRKDQQ